MGDTLHEATTSQEALHLIANDVTTDAALLSILFEHVGEAALAFLDTDFNFLLVNEEYAAGSGHSVEELIGRNHFELFPNPENERLFTQARDTGEKIEFRAKPFEFADQPWRGVTYWDWCLFPVKQNEAVTGLLLSLVDVTGHVRDQQYSDALTGILAHFVVAQQPDQVLSGIVERSLEVTGAYSSVVWVMEESEWRPWHIAGAAYVSAEEACTAQQRPMLAHAARAGELLFIEDVTDDDRVNQQWLSERGITAIAVIPLVLKARALGVLELVYREGPHVFDVEVRRFLTRLAVATSIALETAEEFERERTVSETLQGALLALPDSIAGIDFAQEYRAASSAARVGGDFYDLFERDDGTVGITIGDVSGKGVQAAALTSLVKHTIRANASDTRQAPDSVIAKANGVVFRTSRPEEFVTVFFAILDCDTGRLTYCNAGHTTSIIMRTDGSIGRLVPNSSFVGAFEDAPYTTSEAQLAVGDVLVAYTDGLTEARAEREQFGESGVLKAVGDMRGRTPGEVAERLIGEVVRFTGDRLSDDLAMLVVRLSSERDGRPTQETLDLGLES